MSVKAVIFDKDGTLMDFESFWVTVSRYAIEEIKGKTGFTSVPVEEALLALDVVDGIANINGILAQDPFNVMGKALCNCFKKYGCTLTPEQMTELTVSAYHGNIDKGKIAPACNNIASVMERLKEMGIILAVVTTDDPYDTEKCLKALGIREYFDAVYTDDGINPTKPDSFAAEELCLRFNLTKGQVIMVGDTMNDVRFARNSGIKAVAVAKNENNANILRKEADIVLHDISELFRVID